MTTSQQPRYGRHAGPEADPEPSVPVQRSSTARTVGEYVALARDGHDRHDREPGFGEWPYGSRTPEPAAPNPYLPVDGVTADVSLPPGGWPGTAALVIGVAGVALGMAPTTAALVWPLTILGVVLGVLGVRRVRSGAAHNGVAAVTGIVFCVAGLALCAAWIAMFTMAGLNSAPPVEGAEQAPAGIVAPAR